MKLKLSDKLSVDLILNDWVFWRSKKIWYKVCIKERTENWLQVLISNFKEENSKSNLFRFKRMLSFDWPVSALVNDEVRAHFNSLITIIYHLLRTIRCRSKFCSCYLKMMGHLNLKWGLQPCFSMYKIFRQLTYHQVQKASKKIIGLHFFFSQCVAFAWCIK